MIKPRLKMDAMEGREGFREALADWFGKCGRDYPWRRTSDPYAVLVSEVMLQQTQIATVLGKGYFTRFMATFPDVETLAAAEDGPLLKVWEGLGYYRRARMLRETARAVISGHGGKFPPESVDLMRLPGIGRYTAGAVRSFAFDLPAAVVDGNVGRVLARVFDFRGAVDDPAGVRRMWDWAEALADPERPRVYNAALMELGQRVCRPGVPDCLACPVAGFCRTREPELLPVKREKVAVSAVDEHALWLRDGEGRVLMHLENGRRRQGLWRLPTREAGEVSGLPVVAESRYAITRYRVTLRVYAGGEPADGEAWILPEELENLPMPSPFRKMIGRLLTEK